MVNSAAQSRILCEGTFQHNISALNENEFHFYGERTAIGLLQGFPGPKCFTKPVVDYIPTKDIRNLSPSVDDIPNGEVKNPLKTSHTLQMKKNLRTKLHSTVIADLMPYYRQS